MFGSNYGKLFENQTRLIDQARNKPPNDNVARKTYSLHKILQEKTFFQKKFSRTRHNRTLQFAYNLRSGVPFVFVGAEKERLIQLLDYLSVASPKSGLFSDWSRNKRVLRTKS